MATNGNDVRYFKLFACCIPVKGATRSTLCDVQRNDFLPIPNGLYDILINHRHNTIDEIKKEYDNQYDETIDEYFQYLEKQEYGFWCEKEESVLFPGIDMTWDEPYLITNAIIDNNNRSDHNYRMIFDQLDELACDHIQIRFFDEVTCEKLENILRLLENLRILFVELIYPAFSPVSLTEIQELIRKYPRVTMVYVHSAKQFEITKKPKGQAANIVYVTDKITDAGHCGNISHKNFSINIKTFTESQKFNTCLNRKISIDHEGYIRNCPSCGQDFGNIKNTALKDAMDKKGFKDLWNIFKDQIEVCKDCEFRYVCTDCRAYIKDPGNIYSKPAKCQYDPYTATGF